MKPKHRTPRVTVYQGEAIELLARRANDPAAELADAIITDPPYNSGSLFPSGRVEDPVVKYAHDGDARGRATFTGDCRDQRAFQWWAYRWLELCRRVAKDRAYLLLFSDWRQLPTMSDCIQGAGWTWRGIIPWNKGRGARAPHRGFFRHQCEYVLWATNGRVAQPTDRGPFDGCITEPVRKNDKFHLTGKPSKVMRQLAECAPAGGLILDPFAGSFTTGVGALAAGRRFTGFELEHHYCRVGIDRLRQAESENAAAAAA